MKRWHIFCAAALILVAILLLIRPDVRDGNNSRPKNHGLTNAVPPKPIASHQLLLPSIRDRASVFHVSSGVMLVRIPGNPGELLSEGVNGFFLSNEVGDRLEISTAERKQLNDDMLASLKEIKKVERANCKIVSQSDDELKIEIGAFPKEGAQIKEKLRAQFLTTLGEERGVFIFELLGRSLNKSFKAFGQKTRKLTGRVRSEGYNEIIEDGVTRGFPFKMSFDTMQQHLFNFKDAPEK